jgi:hypothetical protein
MKFPDYKKLMELGEKKNPSKAIPGTPSFCTTMLKEAYPKYYFGRVEKAGINRAISAGFVPLDKTFFGDKITLTEFNEGASLRFDIYEDKTLGVLCNRDVVIVAMEQSFFDWCLDRDNRKQQEEHERRMESKTKDKDRPFTEETKKMTARQLDESG